MSDTVTENYDKYVMYLSTLEGTPIKMLTESLKEVLTDVNIHFGPWGVKIVDIDPSRMALVQLRLNADRFQKFHCPKPKIAGVSIMLIQKLLKTVGNNDTLTMCITKERPDTLEINIHNSKKRIDNYISYNLLDLDFGEIEVPEVQYDATVTMSCGDFQKYCRELANFSKYVNFYMSRKSFKMKITGDTMSISQTINIEESEDSSTILEINESAFDGDQVVNIGQFDLKFLNLFCKSSTLCSTIKLYLKEGFPVIIVYSVASLGTLKSCLNSKEEDLDD